MGVISTGINENGQIVGYSDKGRKPYHAVIWTDGTAGSIKDLGTLKGAKRYRSYAYDINDNGDIVGTGTNGTWSSPTVYYHALLWEAPTYDLVDIDPYASGHSGAERINDDGQAVGWTDTSTGTNATLWEIDGSITVVDLGNPSGSTDSYALDINNLGQIVGRRYIAGETHATLWEITDNNG